MQTLNNTAMNVLDINVTFLKQYLLIRFCKIIQMNDIKMNKLIQDLKFDKNLNSNFQKLKCDGERHTSFKNFR